jgi:hypothetical protein
MVPFGSDLMFVALIPMGLGIFCLVMGLWAWNVACEAEEEGEDVELPSFTGAQTSYRKPWFQKLFAIVALLMAALFIGESIWFLITW